MKKEAYLQDMQFVLSTWKRHYPHKLPPMRILRIFESFEQIAALIEKEVTEEGIQKKTIEMIEIISKSEIEEAMSFIRKIIGEIHGRK